MSAPRKKKNPSRPVDNASQNESIPQHLDDSIVLEATNLPQETKDKILSSFWRGPLPPPSCFADYERVLPGAADRILAMAEREMSHRHDQDDQMVKLTGRGQWFGSGIALIAAIIAIWALERGYPWVAGSTGLGSLLTLAIAYVSGRKPERSESPQDETQGKTPPISRKKKST